ncbi:MAG: hypothetical protein EPO07_07160 [Verrucomicrobia bacterium]|nr:MAG: hypothetical protein EPO07_07160 [Verrucomicrobiota bacterium]
MKTKASSAAEHAFTRRDLIAALAVVGALVVCVALPFFGRARSRARAICCNCNLKQIGLGFRQWAMDHSESYQMGVSTNLGGSMEYLDNGQTFQHFRAASNELNTPFVLVCPEDSREPVRTFDNFFSNSNLSYFVGVVTNTESPLMFLAGDRRILGGNKLANGILELTSENVIGWEKDLHKSRSYGVLGNIALADGSVQGFTDARLREALKYTGETTNRFSMP